MKATYIHQMGWMFETTDLLGAWSVLSRREEGATSCTKLRLPFLFSWSQLHHGLELDLGFTTVELVFCCFRNSEDRFDFKEVTQREIPNIYPYESLWRFASFREGVLLSLTAPAKAQPST